MSRITLYKEPDSGHIRVVTDCEESLSEIIWRISQDAKSWNKLEFDQESIPFHGNIYYFVEARCAKQKVMGGGNYSLIQPFSYSQQPIDSNQDTSGNQTIRKSKKNAMPKRVEWDFSLLPKSEYPKVLVAFEETDYYTLREIHHQYQLSENLYCCGEWRESVYQWYKKAIDDGTIQ